ncbi:O-antigen ligase family protein [Nitratireductor thuwali]|uniref:O-antigen ligase-related domain-containing protein n=1 Tax=Nitratireductor thuwali TaxID=2267699 RepID=A0ABY5MGC9_9HYPH|nr:hypothetical protein NTH_00246 [Nitratireductor thuwali]
MNLPTTNRFFTLACVSVAPALGSVVSFIWHGGALWCFSQIALGRRRFSPDRAMWVVAALLSVYVAASLASFAVNDPRMDDIGSLASLATFLLVPFSYSVWSVSDKTAIARAAALGGMIAGYSACAVAIVEYGLTGLRAEGGAGNALVFATATAMLGPLSLGGMLAFEWRWRWVMGGGYVASLAALVLSGSRLAWVSAALILLAMLVVWRKEIWRLARGQLLAMAAVLALIGVLSSGIVLERAENVAADWEQLQEGSDYQSSLGLRLALWQIGLQSFAERPLLGSGMHNTEEIIREGLREGFGIDRGFTHFHNGLLTLLVESGLIGGGAIAATLFYLAYLAFRGLRASGEPLVRFGSFTLIILVVSSLAGGSLNIVIGHDILDTLFVMFIIMGVYLSAGTSLMPEASRLAAAPSAS